MYQSWRSLLFLHWEVDPDTLRPHIPRALELDLYQGRAFVGLVPFTMRKIRPAGLPALPWLSSFHETNVRTYVHNAGRDPGVWFFSLDAQSALAVLGGRAFFGLPYFRADLACQTAGATTTYLLRRKRGPEAALRARWTILDDRPHQARADTLGHFLTERYALYGQDRRGLYRVRVHHPPWPLQAARLDELQTTLASAAGISVGEALPLVLASPQGVSVETFAAERLNALV
jgi:uncharacterized protein YqjF (DUF2071 family)